MWLLNNKHIIHLTARAKKVPGVWNNEMDHKTYILICKYTYNDVLNLGHKILYIFYMVHTYFGNPMKFLK